MKLFLKSYELE